MKTRSIAFLAASLLALSVSHPGFAQEDSGATPNEAESAPSAQADSAQADSTQQDASGQEQETPPTEGEQAEAEQAEGEAAEGEAAEGEAAQASDTAAPAVDGGAQAKAEGSDEPKTGPGGKPLREDYPGTEESKKARMDTDRIEGLDFEEGETSDEVYDVRIRELETKVDDLKEKVFRSKSRIVLLKETVLTGNLSGSRAIVTHENDIGGTYVLKRAHYSLDGSRVFNKTDQDGDLADKDEFELFNGSITPGNHRMSILLELQGSGYGVFSYMDGYKFTIKDSCEFKAQEGRSTILRVRLIDRGEAFSAYEERPGIECVLSAVNLSDEGLEGDKKDSDTKDDGGAETPPDEDVSATN